jgi:opacity protein-like surface antigen
MKKFLLPLIACAVGTLPLHAGLYLRGGLLYQQPADIKIAGVQDYKAGIDSALGGNLAIGGKVSVLRLEGEIQYFKSDIKDSSLADVMTSGDLTSSTLFANVLFEIPFTPMIEPYVGVGIGINKVDIDLRNLASTGSLEQSFTSSADSHRYGIQAMAGVRISFWETVSVYAGYRYVHLESLSFVEGSYNLKAKGGSHMFEIGLGLGF